MLLLQIKEVYEPALMSRLVDQMFSIVLLVGFAIYSVREQAKTNSKMNKYIEEDRKEMIEVIKNNTEALKIINNKMLHSVLAFFFIFLSSCSSVKKSSQTQLASQIQQNQQLLADSSKYELTEQKTTTTGVPEKKLSAKLVGDDLKPVYNDKGEAKPNTTIFSGKGISLKATANPDGSIDLNANCDSITLINQVLRRELKELKNSTTKSAVKTNTQFEVATKQKIKKAFSWLAFSIGIVSGATLYWLSSKFQVLSVIKKMIS